MDIIHNSEINSVSAEIRGYILDEFCSGRMRTYLTGEHEKLSN